MIRQMRLLLSLRVPQFDGSRSGASLCGYPGRHQPLAKLLDTSVQLQKSKLCARGPSVFKVSFEMNRVVAATVWRTCTTINTLCITTLRRIGRRRPDGPHPCRSRPHGARPPLKFPRLADALHPLLDGNSWAEGALLLLCLFIDVIRRPTARHAEIAPRRKQRWLLRRGVAPASRASPCLPFDQPVPHQHTYCTTRAM